MKSSFDSPFIQKLLGWYHANARNLPWRSTKDPYSIWISEIMLQQTQVKTVIPYYQRWMKRFPDVQTLAGASEDEVLLHWAGLGYYRRAKMLLEAAKKICAHSAGVFPKTTEELIKIPGIGRYTAGAIASISFEQRAPILDGNVIRVLTRLHAVAENVAHPSTIQKLWDLSESLLPSRNVGDFNQALMELGATLCAPNIPRCRECPVKSHCQAWKDGQPDLYPIKYKAAAAIKTQSYALILKHKDRVLIEKQSAQRRWKGLWMFPHWQEKKAMFEETGLEGGQLKVKSKIQHCFTKYRITLNVFEPQGKYLPAHSFSSGPQKKWVKISKLQAYAFPSPHQKIVRNLIAK